MVGSKGKELIKKRKTIVLDSDGEEEDNFSSDDAATRGSPRATKLRDSNLIVTSHKHQKSKAEEIAELRVCIHHTPLLIV